MDSDAAKILIQKIKEKQESINDLAARIDKANFIARRMEQERLKAKQSQEAADKLRKVALTALQILERPPCSN